VGILRGAGGRQNRRRLVRLRRDSRGSPRTWSRAVSEGFAGCSRHSRRRSLSPGAGVHTGLPTNRLGWPPGRRCGRTRQRTVATPVGRQAIQSEHGNRSWAQPTLGWRCDSCLSGQRLSPQGGFGFGAYCRIQL